MANTSAPSHEPRLASEGRFTVKGTAMTTPNVTQADRDAARQFIMGLFDTGFSPDDVARFASEAFSRHRLAALSNTNEQTERAAIVAWLREQSGEGAGPFQRRNLSFQIAAKEFADAIERGDHLQEQRR